MEAHSNLAQGDYTMNPEIVNMYIERLLKEVEEATRARILIETQLKYTEKLNADLQDRIKQLEEQIEIRSTKEWARSVINKKEVSTSD